MCEGRFIKKNLLQIKSISPIPIDPKLKMFNLTIHKKEKKMTVKFTLEHLCIKTTIEDCFCGFCKHIGMKRNDNPSGKSKRQ